MCVGTASPFQVARRLLLARDTQQPDGITSSDVRLLPAVSMPPKTARAFATSRRKASLPHEVPSSDRVVLLRTACMAVFIAASVGESHENPANRMKRKKKGGLAFFKRVHTLPPKDISTSPPFLCVPCTPYGSNHPLSSLSLHIFSLSPLSCGRYRRDREIAAKAVLSQQFQGNL